MSITKIARLTDNDQALNTKKLRQVWQNINEESCPFQYNFHMHTVCSDGQLTPESLMAQVIKIGLKGMAITDHHSVNGFYRAKNWLEKQRQSNPQVILPHLWTGIEITSYLNDTKVHILGYGFNPECYSLQDYLTGDEPQGKIALAENVINAIHQASGVSILAHPARYRRSAKELIIEAYKSGIDGVETYYAYGNPYPWQPTESQTKIIKQLAIKYNLLQTCGTDTHGSNLLVKL